jgi:hypothetical protein
MVKKKKKKIIVKRKSATRSTSPVKSKASKSSVYDEFVRPSSELTLKHPVVNLHGPIGAGKTTCALSACADKSKMLWISADNGATDPFATRGIEVPEFQIIEFMSNPDLWRRAGFNKAPDIVQTMSFASKYAANRVQAGITRWVVVDTPSTLTVYTVNYWDQRFPDDGFKMWRHNLKTFQRFHETLKFSGAGIIYCLHSRPVDNSDAAKRKDNEIRLVADGGRFKIDMPGQAADLYKREASFQFYIKVEKEPGRKSTRKRVAYLACDDGETKNRFEDCLPDKMEPDISLAFKRIEKKLGRKLWED